MADEHIEISVNNFNELLVKYSRIVEVLTQCAKKHHDKTLSINITEVVKLLEEAQDDKVCDIAV